jgi:hypoxanthine phosphoribosyltransferase
MTENGYAIIINGGSTVSKINPIEIKGLWDKGYSIDKHSKASVYSALIADDIYDTGKTLNDAVAALKTDDNLVNVYVLTMTKKSPAVRCQ